MINHIGDCKSNGKTLHDEYLALAWIMLTAALGVINVFWFGQTFSFSSWIKLSCSLMYSAFMVYYACSASGRTFYFYITIAAGLLAAVLLSQAVLLAVHWLFRWHGQDAHEDHFA